MSRYALVFKVCCGIQGMPWYLVPVMVYKVCQSTVYPGAKGISWCPRCVLVCLVGPGMSWCSRNAPVSQVCLSAPDVTQACPGFPGDPGGRCGMCPDPWLTGCSFRVLSVACVVASCRRSGSVILPDSWWCFSRHPAWSGGPGGAGRGGPTRRPVAEAPPGSTVGRPKWWPRRVGRP